LLLRDVVIMNNIWSKFTTDIIIPNDTLFYAKFSLPKNKQSRFSANRHIPKSEQMSPLQLA